MRKPREGAWTEARCIGGPMRTVSFLLAFMLPIATASVVRALDITTCGATVPPNEIGVLQADLVCTGGYAVELQAGATLDLNAHTVTYGGGGAAVWPVVQCSGRSCTVRSSAANQGRIVGTYDGSCLWGTDVV